MSRLRKRSESIAAALSQSHDTERNNDSVQQPAQARNTYIVLCQQPRAEFQVVIEVKGSPGLEAESES